VDLQFSPAGNERIGFVPDNGKNNSPEGYLVERDIQFYEKVEDEVFLNMTAGSFAVFFPWDVHRPGCAVHEPAPIRKVVIKIHMSLFE
jgi:YhcH/YjgK/YiaL family protein